MLIRSFLQRRAIASLATLALSTLSFALHAGAALAQAQTLVPVANRITASDGTGGDSFGYSVSLSGNTALVGALHAGIGQSANQGAAYLFDIATGAQTAKLVARDGTVGSSFGYSVSLSGNTALVGAFSTNVGQNANQGSAYLFNAATGAQTAKLVASDGAENDYFGGAVALSGNTALIGAYRDDGIRGSAYLFNTITGGQTAKLLANDGAANSFFGSAVAVSGNTALIGARGARIGANPSQGAAYLFDTTTGTQTAKLIANDGTFNDLFGASVALSGSFALIGAFADDSDRGAAYLFDTTSGAQLFKFVAGDRFAGDQFGTSVALSGNTALIGASGTNVGQGSVYAFDLTTKQLIAKYVSVDGAVDDRFGSSVSLDGSNAIAGAFADDAPIEGQGSAYRFTVANTAAAAAPEPVSIALMLSAGVPVSGLVYRRRKKH